MSSADTMIESTDATAAEMLRVVELQRKDFLAEGYVSLETRLDRLKRGKSAISKYKGRLVEALSEDYHCRPPELSLLTEIAGSILPFKSAIQHTKHWMKPQKRKSLFPLAWFGARSRVEYQPLGVVGVMSPWNFPVNISLAPLAEILAAGNRAVIKPSEVTPTVAAVLAEMVKETWDEKEVTVFNGGTDVSAAFSELPLDHLIFTGSTTVGRHIMAAAAKNLVPVTLELGGKSPVLISRTAKMKEAVDRFMLAKTMNAGQICLAPDYLNVPEEKLGEAIEAAKTSVGKMFKSLLDNPEYAAIINERHFQRLTGLVDDARAKGAEIIEINPSNEDFSAQAGYKIPPTLVLNATDDMQIMHEEIFGPLLPVRTYKAFTDSIDYINSKPRPLALYYFGKDAQEERTVLDRTTSGGVTINDVLMHSAQEDLPFGGVGASGMGAYHGHTGFKTFSHEKAIFKQGKVDIAALGGMRPPYGFKTKSSIKMQTKDD